MSEYRQLHRKYTVIVHGDKISIPHFCTCCMRPVRETEKHQYKVKNSQEKYSMPLCDTCKEHRKQSSHAGPVICLSILLGLLVMFLLLHVFAISELVAALTGFFYTLFFFFLIAGKRKLKPLRPHHSSCRDSVEITSSVMGQQTCLENETGKNKNIEHLTFTFTNWEYAYLFKNENKDISGPIGVSVDLNDASCCTVLQQCIYKKTISIKIILIVLIYALFSMALAAFSMKYSFTRVFSTKGVEQKNITASMTDAPAATPRSTVTQKPNRTSTAKKTATSKKTSTPRPTATPKVVFTYNGRVFITPDYKQVCKFTVNADNTTNYYIYLEYIGRPSVTTEGRELKDNVKNPYEGDIAFYVSAGSTATVGVPIGVYKLYYSTGDTFYGTKLLFGDETRCYISNDTFSFNNLSGYTHWTVTLYKVRDGNMETREINENVFPKR